MEDAAEILGGMVTGQAKGKPITLPAVQAMFRILCNRALKGDNRALRVVSRIFCKRGHGCGGGPCGQRAALSTGRWLEHHAAMRRASFLCSRRSSMFR
jgi:hypothetical protein